MARMNLRLNFSGTSQMKRCSIALMSSPRSSRSHSVRVNAAPSSSWLEFPDDRLGAVGDEHLAEGVRILQQPLAQQAELLLEQLDRLAVGEFLQLVAGRVVARVLARSEALHLARRRASASRAHRMISASQLAATRTARLSSSGVTVSCSSTPGYYPADLLGHAIDDDPGLFKHFAQS